MAEKKAFDLAALLGGVSVPAAEQIELLPWDKLLPDERNFYSLEGLEDLADSIATVGLLDPIRVRPDGDAYVVISGHRRRAAIKLLIDSGEERWKTQVPCIVERAEISAELAELKLIFANASTRRMSSAEMSRQAARVEELLYALKGQGFAFPGRMQAHVAQACGTTESKLKRLHAIRANLDPALLAFYDSGEFVEDAAYQMSKFAPEIQARVAEAVAKRNRKLPNASVLSRVWDDLKENPDPPICKAQGGIPCPEAEKRLVRNILTPYSWQVCSRKRCCTDCPGTVGCTGGCPLKREKEKASKEKQADEDRKRKEARAREQEELRARIRARSAELLPLIDRAGLRDNETLTGDYSTAKVKEIRRWAAGDAGDDYFYTYSVVAPESMYAGAKMAKRLGCSLLYAMDAEETAREVEPEPEPAAGPAAPPEPGWQTGKPERAGRYFVTLLIRDERRGDSVSEHRAEWKGGEWWLYDQRLGAGFELLGWWPLPARYSEAAIEE